ncbi:MAG: hypothetical protein SFZ23_04025 [Planctomycetota bacterium]|nr:hypothetical protein [Planctomycetota bacterium]
MSRQSKQVDPLRLCDAAEAVMIAVVEASEHFGGRWPYPPDLMGTRFQPAALNEFSRDEVNEATMFLIRMGFLEAPRSVA